MPMFHFSYQLNPSDSLNLFQDELLLAYLLWAGTFPDVFSEE